MMRCGCACTAAPVSKGTVLGLLEESAVAIFAPSEAVSYLVCDDNGYVFGAGKVAE